MWRDERLVRRRSAERSFQTSVGAALIEILADQLAALAVLGRPIDAGAFDAATIRSYAASNASVNAAIHGPGRARRIEQERGDLVRIDRLVVVAIRGPVDRQVGAHREAVELHPPDRIVGAGSGSDRRGGAELGARLGDRLRSRADRRGLAGDEDEAQERGAVHAAHANTPLATPGLPPERRPEPDIVGYSGG